MRTTQEIANELRQVANIIEPYVPRFQADRLRAIANELLDVRPEAKTIDEQVKALITAELTKRGV